MTAEIIGLPYKVTRRLHSRKPRNSKNGTPEERAAKAVKVAGKLTTAKPGSDDAGTGVVAFRGRTETAPAAPSNATPAAANPVLVALLNSLTVEQKELFRAWAATVQPTAGL